MNEIFKQFKAARYAFDKTQSKESGNQVMLKITALVNELGQTFTALDGGELSEKQFKLSGYKFYLSDYISDLNRVAKSLKIEIKNIKADRWEEITNKIKAVKGKVSNKEQIENVLQLDTKEIQNQQILYETTYEQYKLKLSAVDDILTAIVQRVAELKRQIELSKKL